MNAVQTYTRPEAEGVSKLHCRLCNAPLTHIFADLGAQPLCESYLSAAELHASEPFYPLRVYVCERCFLAQAEAFESPEAIFSDYAYFASYSESWLEHARRYTTMATERFELNRESFVVEVASNDGYLLKNFVARGIPALGVDPAANIAAVAEKAGVPTRVAFFGGEVARELADEGKQADLIVANNVLAHTPHLHDFAAGLGALLKPDGVATLEFAYLPRLMAENQFDTIYHEHFSYLSLLAVERLFKAHGLALFDAEELPTHGGSLRIYAGHEGVHAEEARLSALREREHEAGLDTLEPYLRFSKQVVATKHELLKLLISLKDAGKQIAGYGAPGKGNTLLNYCGIREDFLDYTVDRNPYKQGRFLPGTHVPIHAPEKIRETRPDYILILPWNLKDEIVSQLAYVRDWGAKFIVPIPEPRLLS